MVRAESQSSGSPSALLDNDAAPWLRAEALASQRTVAVAAALAAES
jgi:hypothetical protein